ncbi:MAG: hypothetical protein HKN85_05305 [Gammaproteobacteria bacterium]|nr:hypothetical protein [Gammaproteobacteria bacterium]
MISFSKVPAVRLVAIFALLLMLSACVGGIIGAVADTTIAVAKVPFKVGGAIIDVVTPDDLSEQGKVGENDPTADSDEAAVRMESEPF